MPTHDARPRPSRRIGLPLAAAVLLGGCAQTHDAVMRLYASEVTAHAIVGEHLLSGPLRLYTDRSGTLELAGEPGAPSCMGALRYTSSNGGTVQLRCSDGSHWTLTFRALSEASGYGSTNGASLAYGLKPAQARAWLQPPAGRQLQAEGERLRLTPATP